MAGISASDLRAILPLPLPISNNDASSQHQPPTKKPIAKRPNGMSREVYNIIGPSAPSLVVKKPQYKQRPNVSGSKWEWRSFKNSARSDSLSLSHWTKGGSSNESSFAKYNVQSSVYTYTPEEYSQFLQDEDWTKEETDHLFQLVREYDLRWYVIFDRYEDPSRTGDAKRTIDDLKDRYYTVARKLVKGREWTGDEASKTAALASLQFNKENERRRKTYIESLDARTPEQIAEENALFMQLKKLEQTERKFKAERDLLLLKLGGIESGLPHISEDDPSTLSGDPSRKRKKGGGHYEPETPSTPSISAAAIKHDPVYDAKHCIQRYEVLPGVATKAAHLAAYLRTTKIPFIKPNIAPKVTSILSEVDMPHLRLVMPTRENVNKLESLVDTAVSIAEAKRVSDKLDLEIRTLQERLANLDGADAMELEDGAVGEDGRSASVASSSRGARSRKPTERSMSVSSVDTNVAGPRKKQRR